MEPKISIIVPVYNVEEHLPRCLDSLVGQSLPQIEIICVDDGSPDCSIDILRQYEAQDPRVKVLSQENRGPGGARNRGFDEARGEYVLFVDADDWLDETFCERLYDAACGADADVACASILKIKLSFSRWTVCYTRREVLIDAVAKCRACLCPPDFYVMNKLLRRDMLLRLGLRFPERVCYEDVVYVSRLLCECGRLVTVPGPCYYYWMRTDSTINSVQTSRKQRDKYEAHKQFVAYADRHGIPLDARFRDITRRDFRFGISWLKIKDNGWRIAYKLLGFIPVHWYSVRSGDGSPRAVAPGEPLTVAFDAKRITHNATGLGNYGRMIVDMLVRFAPCNRYLLFSPDPGREDLRERVSGAGQVELRYPVRPRRGLGRMLWRTLGICGELPSDVDLFHGLSGELPFNIQKTGIASVVTIHDLIFLRYPSYYKWIDRKIYAFKARRACKQADRVIAISEATRRDIVAFFGIAPEKIDVVYQGCDDSFKRDVPDDMLRAVREKYALPERYILFVGSLEPRKNLLLIMQAVALLSEPVHVVAIGKRTPYTAEVEKYAAQNGLTERLHIFNRVAFPELPAFYRMASVFVYPSRFEGFGIPMIEAACCGVPTIGATGSCLEEAGGPDALYVDPDDPVMLAQQIGQVLSDAGLRERMIRGGRAYVTRFEPDVLAADLLEVYRRVVEG